MSQRRVPRRVAMRRSLPPRPTYGAVGTDATAAPASVAMTRPQRLVEREAPYLLDELKRVALVSGTCIGLLIFLTVVDHLRR
jgi:hypothetical protein